jgi:TRAP-type C4-dicarboxylate transport system substrate-binding protein
MKKTLALFSVLLVMFLFVGMMASGAAHAADKKPVVLRLVVPIPTSDYPLGTLAADFAKRFNARAGSTGYKMEAHGGGALAKLPEYFDALRVGSVEMACAPWGFYAFMDPRLALIETPFLINNQEAGAYAAKAFLPLYDQILQEKFNQKGLGLMSLGGVELISNKPVKTIEDWKGLLVGALSPTTAAMIKDLGGAPTTIMWTDYYESLQKKVVDAVTTGTHGAVATNLHDVCKNVTLFYGINSWNGYSVNLDIWKKMPANVQKILQEEAQKTVDEMHKIMTKLDADDLKAFKEKGVTVYSVPPTERDRWIKALAPYKEKQLSSFGDFGTKIKQIADDANKKFPYKGMAVK